jgi:hypothetical protein
MNKQRVYDRGVDLETIRALVNGLEINLRRDDVLQRLNVDTMVRIPDSVYPQEGKPGDFISHFGLPIHGDHAGSIAAMPKILEHGYFRRTGEEMLPLLSFEKIWLAQIVECFESISYDNLLGRFFKNTIGKATDTDSLKQLILNRYQNQLPDRSHEEILSEGVSIRILRLVEKVSLPEVL